MGEKIVWLKAFNDFLTRCLKGSDFEARVAVFSRPFVGCVMSILPFIIIIIIMKITKCIKLF